MPKWIVTFRLWLYADGQRTGRTEPEEVKIEALGETDACNLVIYKYSVSPIPKNGVGGPASIISVIRVKP